MKRSLVLSLLQSCRLSALLSRALLLVVAGTALTTGCATENKITKGPHFTLNHPDYWKVKSVATKDGEPTTLSIGRYSETVMSEGTGSTASSQFEASQADVEVRIFTWPGVDDGGNPSMKVAQLLTPIADLELPQHMRVPADKECSSDFTRKYTLAGETREPLDLLKRPGFRTIIVGGKTQGLLVGVLARVPYEQDPNLYCHNLGNMRTQLGLLLEALTITPDAAPAAAPAAPAGDKPADPAAAPPAPAAAAPTEPPK